MSRTIFHLECGHSSASNYYNETLQTVFCSHCGKPKLVVKKILSERLQCQFYYLDDIRNRCGENAEPGTIPPTCNEHKGVKYL